MAKLVKMAAPAKEAAKKVKKAIKKDVSNRNSTKDQSPKPAKKLNGSK